MLSAEHAVLAEDRCECLANPFDFLVWITARKLRIRKWKIGGNTNYSLLGRYLRTCRPSINSVQLSNLSEGGWGYAVKVIQYVTNVRKLHVTRCYLNVGFKELLYKYFSNLQDLCVERCRDVCESTFSGPECPQLTTLQLLYNMFSNAVVQNLYSC